MKESPGNEIRARRSGVGALVALNAALLGALAVVTFSNAVGAQGYRAPGRYHAVSGGAPGWDPGIVYIVDETNQQLVAMTYDPNTRVLVGVGARDLAVDIAQGRSR